jgi:hypothetical protein
VLEIMALAAEDADVTHEKDAVTQLFRKPPSRAQWMSDWLTAHLKKAGIRHRGPNETAEKQESPAAGLARRGFLVFYSGGEIGI